jgi:hypothetical protein
VFTVDEPLAGDRFKPGRNPALPNMTLFLSYSPQFQPFLSVNPEGPYNFEGCISHLDVTEAVLLQIGSSFPSCETCGAVPLGFGRWMDIAV